jgi:hypothetical protein
MHRRHMTVEDFAKWQAEQTSATGTRPDAVCLSNEDVRSIMDELQESVTSTAVVGVGAPRLMPDGLQASVSRRPGFCMKLMGTDVYRSGDVAIGTIAQISE